MVGECFFSFRESLVFAGEPVRFGLDPVMVYVWEYQLLNPNPDLSETYPI